MKRVSRKGKFIKLLAATIIIVGAAYLLWPIGEIPTTVVTPQLPPNSESILVDWVYSNSNRISRDECIKIVKEVVKTSKPLLLLAIIEVESNFVPTATSAKGAIGLTQIMPGVWDKDLITKGIIKERRDLYNIEPSIKAGDYIFNLCLVQAKGNIEKALEHYLGGRDGAYVKRILSTLAALYLITDVRLN